MSGQDGWAALARGGPARAVVGGAELRQGSRVRLRPRSRGDVLDLALEGRSAVVEAIEQDVDGSVHVAVVVEGDPGHDLGAARQPGHRFFFSLDEVEPEAGEPGRRVLIAGIGNVFCGDDGFGVEVARRLAPRPLPPGVHVADFGIRGFDLAYALQAYEAAVLVDAVARGEPPGTLFVIEPEGGEGAGVTIDTHGMHPARVLAMARGLGRVPERTLVVGCEPQRLASEEGEEVLVGLSAPVAAAVGRAAALAEQLAVELLGELAARPG